MSAKRRRGRLLPPFLPFAIVFGLLIQPNNTQFGEIASVITGLLGSGGGLAGTGAASGLSGLGGLAGAGASAGSGAASALGSVGQLYQLAQAALQLTGTGVGIANQASESAWFPVAVENAAKMNRDFQDRLLRGGTGVSAGPGFPGFPGLGGLDGAGTSKLGTEYGKNFESGEGLDYQETAKPESSPPPPQTPAPPAPLPTSSFAQRRALPGLVSLLPGESSGHEEEVKVARPSIAIAGQEIRETLDVISSERREEENTHHNQGVAALLSSGENTTPDASSDLGGANERSAYHANRASIESVEAGSKKQTLGKAENKPNIEFSTDNEDEQETGTPLLYPPKASAPTAKSVSSMVTVLEGIDELELPHMVPELKKLIRALKASNLSREDFNEISEQLASNKNVEQPRENTSPAPTVAREGLLSEGQGESRGMKFSNEKRDKATTRNLAALRSALSDQILKRVMHGDHPAPVVISLPRPQNHSRQMERSPAASKLKRLNSPPLPSTKIVHGESGEQPVESATAKAKMFAVTAHARRVLLEGSHKQAGQITQRREAGVSSQQDSVISSAENSRAQIDDATGEQNEPKSVAGSNFPQTAVTASTTASPVTQVPTQQKQYQQQSQQYPANDYQSNNNYQQQQQPVYYPQYGAWYYPQQLQQYSSGQQQVQPQYYYQTTPRTLPARTAPEPVQTTPASLLHHPFGHGALLTLMQPNQMFGRK